MSPGYSGLSTLRKRQSVPNRESGIALVTVLVFLLVIAAVVALRGGEELGEIHLAAADAEVRRLDYVAQAGMQRAVWQARNAACTGDFTIPATALGPDTYSASTTGGGSNTFYTLSADQDAWIRSDNPTNTGGGDQHIRSEGTNFERGLFRFDLSTLPPGAQVKSAVAWFYLEAGMEHPEGPITVHRVTADWTEGGATWDDLGDKSDAATLGMIPAQAVGDAWMPVNLTAQVQAWVNGQPNYGVALASTAEGIHAEYKSREDGSTPPRLEVVVGSGAASPLNIQATGTLDTGVTHTLRRPAASAYQPPASVSLQLGVDPGEDAMTDSFYSARNYGGASYIQINDNGSDWQQYPLIRFDLAKVPRGASVQAAQLELHTRNLNAPGTATIHQVTRSWVEGTKSGTGQPDGASWFTYDGTNSWASAGGDFNPAVVAETAIDGSETWVSWDVAPLVQRWLAGEPNYGLMIRPANGLREAEFESKEDSNAGVAPKLTITYACECGRACMAPQGTGKILLVVDSKTAPVPGDQDLQALLESWGYTVTLIADEAGQTAYNIEMGNNDVVFISESVNAGTLGTKVSAAPIGVVSAEGLLNDELGIATGRGTPVGDTIEVVDNDHYITRIFPTAPLQFKTAATELASVSGTVSPEALVLAEVGGVGSLVALEKGAAAAGGGSVLSRRVLVPAGDANATWNYLTNNGQLIIQRAIAWAMGADATSIANVLLVVVNPGSLTAQEAEKQALMESWSFTVNLIDESDSQANFDAALADNDVVYVPQDISSGNVGTKLTNASIGVVNEEGELVEELDFSGGKIFKTDHEINVLDNSHYITEQFSTGFLTFTSTDQSVHMLSGQIAPGLQTLGETLNTGSQYKPSLGTLDPGDTTSSGGSAAGRRVQLPWGGGTFDINLLTDDGRTIMRRSLEWGAGLGLSLPGPVAYWMLDETSGTTAVDSVGGNDGTLVNGPVWTPGIFDGGLQLDGTNDHVDAGTFDVTGSGITMLGWFNADVIGTDDPRIISKANSTAVAGAWWQLSFSDSGSNRYLRMRIKAGGTTSELIDTTTNLSPGQWYFAAATYDAASGEMKLYLDGTEIASAVHGVGGPVDTDALVSVQIGANGTVERFFDGILDDVRVYDRALSAAEVAELAVPPLPEPIAHWMLDDGSGTAAFDSVGGNDGTLFDGPVWTAGTLGDALDFDGSNDRVTTNGSFTPPPAGTVSFWMQVDGPPAAHGRILGLHDTWEIRHVTDGTTNGIPYGLVFDLGVTGTNNDFVTTTTIDNPGQWYHIAASYDTATDAYAVYIDGAPHKSGTYPSSLTVPSPNPLSLGVRTGSSQHYDGKLDDVRVYDTVLTPAQVAEIAAAGGGGAPPTVFEVRVAAGSDDAEERVSNGNVGLTSSDLELISDNGNAQLVGMRFTNVTVPNAALISNAYVQFQTDETNTGATNLDIQAESIDDAPTFTSSSFGISSRSRTTTSVAWAPPDWTTVGEAGPAQRTPNLSAVVQEVVSRPGWVSGNDMVIIITGSGERTAEAYNGDSAAAPLLHIEYSE